MFVSPSQANKNVDFNTICRLCMEITSSESELINIFENQEKCSLSLRIMACLALEVQSDDNLPKRICFACRHQLEKFHYFRSKCKNTDTKLRRHIRCLNSGKRSRIFDESDGEFEDEHSYTISFLNQWAVHEDETRKLAENEKLAQMRNELSAQIAMENERFTVEETKRIYADVRKECEEKLADELARQQQEQQESSPKAKRKKTVQPPTNKVLNFIKTDPMPLKIESCVLDVLDIDDTEEDQPAPNDDEDGGEDPMQRQDEHLPELTDAVSITNELQDVEELIYDVADDRTDGGEEEENISENFYEVSTDNTDSGDVSFALSAVTGVSKSVGAGKRSETTSFNIEYLDLDDGQSVVSSFDYIAGADATNELHLVDQQTTEIVANDDGSGFKIVSAGKRKKITRGKKVKTETISLDLNDEQVTTTFKDENEIESDDHGLKVYSCTECPAKFSRRISLVRHMYTPHSKRQGAVCQYCDKWFPSSSSVTRHIRTHTGEKPFKCDVCGRSFIQKEILKRHQMTHTGERPFQCGSCDKGFTQKEMLRQHINKMHTENPVTYVHQCSFCPKTFNHASGLSRHLLVHSGVKFGCEFCKKEFNDKSALKRHVASLHNAVTYNKTESE